ncbi:RES domain-containing protein, partial [Vulcanococcus limneticus]|uniref:RES domain-containing protein n=2 Tax=Vulcanococcus limneticus TaxID=2170428 RepID=UPI001E4DDD20
STACGFRCMGPFSRFDHHQQGEPRSILYCAQSLSCCVVECFGDTGVIESQGRRLAFLSTTRALTLLDLQGNGAMLAGSVAALAATADRKLSQAWSCYFYETLPVDGILYSNAHNGEPAIALYERAEPAIQCLEDHPLGDPRLRGHLLQVAVDHALILAASVV